MYTKFWKVLDANGNKVDIFFVKKKDAEQWVSEQENPTDYTIQKVSMN